MGETISYSSGKVPESDVAKLVREAREHGEAANRLLQAKALTYGEQLQTVQFVLRLCDALEERERGVERLRELLGRARWFIDEGRFIEIRGLSESPADDLVDDIDKALAARERGE